MTVLLSCALHLARKRPRRTQPDAQLRQAHLGTSLGRTIMPSRHCMHCPVLTAAGLP